MVDNNPNESVQKRSVGNVGWQVVLGEAIKRIAQVNARIVDWNIVLGGIADTQVDLVLLNFRVSPEAINKDWHFSCSSNMYIYVPIVYTDIPNLYIKFLEQETNETLQE